MPELSTRVLSFWCGPGGGKSTTKAGTFFLLKAAGNKAAQIEEYATERSFEQDWETLADQRKITLEQDRRQRRLLGKVDWIVTDSPIPLGVLYGVGDHATPEFHQEVWDLYNQYDNVGVWIDRVKPYQKYGRHHSEEEARELDARLWDLAKDHIQFRTPGDALAPQRVLTFLQSRFSI